MAAVQKRTDQRSSHTQSGLNLVVLAPTDAQVGDLIVASCFVNANENISISGSGWGTIPTISQPTSPVERKLSTRYIIYDGSFSSITFSFTAAVDAIAMCWALFDFDPANPIGAFEQGFGGSLTDASTPGITGVDTHDGVMFIVAARASTIGSPTGATYASYRLNGLGTLSSGTLGYFIDEDAAAGAFDPTAPLTPGSDWMANLFEVNVNPVVPPVLVTPQPDLGRGFDIVSVIKPAGSYTWHYGGDWGGGYTLVAAVDPNDAQHLVAVGDLWGIRETFNGGLEWLPAGQGLDINTDPDSGFGRAIGFSLKHPGRCYVGTGRANVNLSTAKGSLLRIDNGVATRIVADGTWGFGSNMTVANLHPRPRQRMQVLNDIGTGKEHVFMAGYNGFVRMTDELTPVVLSASSANAKKNGYGAIYLLDASSAIMCEGRNSINNVVAGDPPLIYKLTAVAGKTLLTATGPADVTTAVIAGAPNVVHDIKLLGSTIVAACGVQGLYTVSSDGLTWTNKWNPITDGTTQVATVDGSATNWMVGMCATPNAMLATQNVAVSTNAGTSFTFVTNPSFTVLGIEQLWWHSVAGHTAGIMGKTNHDVSMMVADPGNASAFYEFGRSGAMKTSNLGTQWRPAVYGLNGIASPGGSIFPAPNQVEWESSDYVGFHSDDNGVSASALSTAPPGLTSGKASRIAGGRTYALIQGTPSDVTQDGVSIANSYFQKACQNATGFNVWADAQARGYVYVIQNGGLLIGTPVTGTTLQAGTITSPTAAQVVTTSSFTTTWNAASGGTGPYTYAVSYDGGAFVTPSSTLSDLHTFANGSHTVQVRVTDSLSAQAFTAVTSFSVSVAVGLVAPTITTPAAGSVQTSASFTSAWTAASGGSGTITYTVSYDNAAFSTPTSGISGLTDLHTFTNASHNLRVRATDGVGTTATSSTITFTVAAPVALTAGAIVTPAAGAVLASSSVRTTWNPASGGTPPYTYRISYNNGLTFSTPNDLLNANGPSDNHVFANGNYTAVVQVTDSAGVRVLPAGVAETSRWLYDTAGSGCQVGIAPQPNRIPADETWVGNTRRFWISHAISADGPFNPTGRNAAGTLVETPVDWTWLFAYMNNAGAQVPIGHPVDVIFHIAGIRTGDATWPAGGFADFAAWVYGDGSYIDTCITAWSNIMKTVPRYALTRMWHEMGQPANPYFIPSAQSKQPYIDAWQKVVTRLRALGALGTDPYTAKMGIAWCPAGGFDLNGLNVRSDYFPGAIYTDWIAVDAYNFDAGNLTSPTTFHACFYDYYKQFNKPMMVAENGFDVTDPARISHLTSWASLLQTDFPLIKAVVYWDGAGQDLVDTPAGFQTAFTNAFKVSYFHPDGLLSASYTDLGTARGTAAISSSDVYTPGTAAGVIWGLARTEDLAGNEAIMGRKFAGTRINLNLDATTISAQTADYDAGYHYVFRNNNAQQLVNNVKQPILWSEIAAGLHDDILTAVANLIRTNTRWNATNPYRYCFHHEQTIDTSSQRGFPSCGTVQEYINAYRYVRLLFDSLGTTVRKANGQANGGNAVFCFIAFQGMIFNPNPGQALADFDPDAGNSPAPAGTSYYELAGLDLYNKYLTTDLKYGQDANTVLGPIHNFALAKGKKWMVGEMAVGDSTTAASHQAKANFLTSMRTVIKGYGTGAGSCESLLWSMDNTTDGDQIASSTEAQAAYLAMANDPFFMKTL